MQSTICIVEDREACEPCLRLLIMSLDKHSPQATINVFYPPASDGFLAWISGYPQVRLRTDRLKDGYGWNIKPQAIMRMMDQDFDEVIWLDSDIIVNRNIIPIFSDLSYDTFVAGEHTFAEERWDPNSLRARLWGFTAGRVLPYALNSGVLRVTKAHRRLLERWWQLLQSDTYQDFQKRPWRQRPIHMLGDQDVLTALLTSKEFSDVPIHILRRGKDIIQFDGVFGYTLAERMWHLLGGSAAFVHSSAGKPWSERWETPKSIREFIKMVYLDLSPYTFLARRFKNELGRNTEWMDPHYALSRFLLSLGLGRAELIGLPIAVAMEPVRIAKLFQRSSRLYSSPSKTVLATANKRQ